ncbi:MAG: N-acetylneuraminate synthase family protein [Halioglobus sp.]
MKLGSHTIEKNSVPVFWPDIDVYFKNDFDLALRLVDKITQSGCGFLKGALLHDKSLSVVSDRETKFYHADLGWVSEPYHKITERHVVPFNVLERVFKYAQDAGLEIVLSVYDFEGVDFAENLGACAIKIPSSNIVHRPLIEYAGKTKLPLVLDTGRSHFFEIERAVHWTREIQVADLIVQHSQPAPPEVPSSHHLNMMKHMGDTFSCVYGLSDHFPGDEALVAAVALGASVLEKGLIPEGIKPDIDVGHALSVERLTEVVSKIEITHQMMGNDVRLIPDSAGRPQDRMGLIAKRDIQSGESFSYENTTFAFPTLGVPVERFYDIKGNLSCRDIRKGSPILQEYVTK